MCHVKKPAFNWEAEDAGRSSDEFGRHRIGRSMIHDVVLVRSRSREWIVVAGNERAERHKTSDRRSERKGGGEGSRMLFLGHFHSTGLTNKVGT
jgi:hypothetical protein